MKKIQVKDLITIHDRLKQYLKKLDSKNTEHRQLIIEAIKSYIKRYINPALHLAFSDSEGNKYININDVVGEQITGMAFSAIFDMERQDLSRPSDEKIEYIFQEILEHNGTPEIYEKFWQAWLVREAQFCINRLCNFLDEPLTKPVGKQIPADALRQEIKQLQHLYESQITEDVKLCFELLLKWEKRALAEWTNDPKNFITIES